MAFATPDRDENGEREYFELKHHVGSLLTVKVRQLDEAWTNPKFTKDGAKPTVWGDVTIIDGEHAGKTYRNARFGGLYVYQYVEGAHEKSPGDLVLARLTRGDQGGRPYFFNHPDADDIELATQFYADGGPAEEDPRDEDDEDTPPWEQ